MLVWADKRRWVSRGLVPSSVLDRATNEVDTPRAPRQRAPGEPEPV
jgi:hypothetical protein